MVRQFKEGLDFVFEDNECLIFIEDDHFLEPSFYKFACEILHKYRFEDRISHINLSASVLIFLPHVNFHIFSVNIFQYGGLLHGKELGKHITLQCPNGSTQIKIQFLTRFASV